MILILERIYYMLFGIIDIKLCSYTDISDSAHVYGQDFDNAWLEAHKYSGDESGYINRSYNITDDIVQEIKKEAYQKI